MRRLSASELLDVWESGLAQLPVQRALTLLAAGRSQSRDDLAILSIGQRDAGLLEFREETFGRRLICLTTCRGCGERLEVSFNASDLRVPSQPAEPAILSLQIDEFEVQFRPPNSLDLLAISDSKDIQAGREALLRRCILRVEQSGKQKTVDDLPATVVETVVERMGEADPQADVQLAFSCPGCAHQWQDGFDIVSFLWSELNAWAHRTLRDVHTLASAYGWHESEILALSPGRRQAYLEMVGP